MVVFPFRLNQYANTTQSSSGQYQKVQARRIEDIGGIRVIFEDP